MRRPKDDSMQQRPIQHGRGLYSVDFGFVTQLPIGHSFISVNHLVVILLHIFAPFLDSLRARFAWWGANQWLFQIGMLGSVHRSTFEQLQDLCLDLNTQTPKTLLHQSFDNEITYTTP